MTIAEPVVSHLELAKPRMAVYRFLLASLDKPSLEQHAWLLGPSFQGSLSEVGRLFDLDAPLDELAPPEFADFQSRYLACFEVGMPEPPIVPQASYYNRKVPAPATIHEHVLFYKRFGMWPLDSGLEHADHVSNQLCFLIYLDGLAEAGALDAESIILARRDFLKRQVVRWTASAAAAAEEKLLPSLYRFLLRILAIATAQDLELCQAVLDSLALEGSRQ